MKKALIFILVGAFIVIGIIIVGLLFATAGAATAVNEISEEIEQEQVKIENDVENLAIEDLHQEGDKLIGTITNTLDYNISYLEVKFKFYDKDGITINDDFTNKTDFVVGEKWRFEIYLIEENFDSYDYDLEMSVY